jgi:hypothetical protein
MLLYLGGVCRGENATIVRRELKPRAGGPLGRSNLSEMQCGEFVREIEKIQMF